MSSRFHPHFFSILVTHRFCPDFCVDLRKIRRKNSAHAALDFLPKGRSFGQNPLDPGEKEARTRLGGKREVTTKFPLSHRFFSHILAPKVSPGRLEAPAHRKQRESADQNELKHETV